MLILHSLPGMEERELITKQESQSIFSDIKTIYMVNCASFGWCFGLLYFFFYFFFPCARVSAYFF